MVSGEDFLSSIPHWNNLYTLVEHPQSFQTLPFFMYFPFSRGISPVNVKLKTEFLDWKKLQIRNLYIK